MALYVQTSMLQVVNVEHNMIKILYIISFVAHFMLDDDVQCCISMVRSLIMA